jgi:hypothetical protein
MLRASEPSANQYGPNPNGAPARPVFQPRPDHAQSPITGGPFEFTNPRLFNSKPLTDPERVVLLAPAQAERLTRFHVLIGTVPNTAGDSITRVRQRCPMVDVGHPITETLFEFAGSGGATVEDDIIRTAIDAAELKTVEEFLGEPPSAYQHCVREMPSNERTGSPFFVVIAYA